MRFTRGTVSDALVEAIDLAPTFVEFRAGAAAVDERSNFMEGKSLMPLLRGELSDHTAFRDYAISEYDFAFTPVRERLGLEIEECRWFVVVTQTLEVHSISGKSQLPPILFDLKNDPNELTNLGHSEDPEHQAAMAELREKLEHWSLRISQRFTKNSAAVQAMTGRSATRGVTLGFGKRTRKQNHCFLNTAAKLINGLCRKTNKPCSS